MLTLAVCSSRSRSASFMLMAALVVLPLFPLPSCLAFQLVTPSLITSSATSQTRGHSCSFSLSSSLSSSSSSPIATKNDDDSSPEQTTSKDPLGLTPELRKITNAFASIGDDKLRYKQLLYMAGQLPPMDVSLKVAENKVPGCLSTVHVHASVVESEEDEVQEGMRVRYSGDSDGLLTKGLVSLLVRGLSECTASQIQLVDPAFIQEAGIAASLTPGRNNGFLNMLAVMKRKAREAEQQALEARQTKTSREAARSEVSQRSTAVGSTKRSNGRRPKYDAMMRALQSQLHPVRLELVDKSHEHTGHAGSQGLDGESHFDLYVVSKEFDGLNMIKRHRLVYATLGDVMPTIHALQIRAQTPAEAGLSHEVL